jgi:hypothetical protein
VFADKRFLFVGDFLQPPDALAHRYTFQLRSPGTVGEVEVRFEQDRVTWPGYQPTTRETYPVTLTTCFAGEVALSPLESHWIRDYSFTVYRNVALGASWESTGPTALLTGLIPNRPSTLPATVTPSREGPVQRLEVRTDEAILWAALSPAPARLSDGTDVQAEGRLLVTARTAAGALRWLYAWDAQQVTIAPGPTLRAAGATPLPALLLARAGDGWRLHWPGETAPFAATATGVTAVEGGGRRDGPIWTLEGGKGEQYLLR